MMTTSDKEEGFTYPKMKKLINDPGNVVKEMVEGAIAMYPNLYTRLEGWNVIIRRDINDIKDKQVTLISGGGSGHEPAHALYVGHGMLSAAVCGEVFTSPDLESILATIRVVTGSKGCLLIVKNYTGDRLNFGLAAELARAEGYKVEMVVVGDDCALHSGLDREAREQELKLQPKQQQQGGSEDAEAWKTLLEESEDASRRGIAGTVLVHKIAGAAAEAGKSLKEVLAEAEHAARSISTMGVALGSCYNPNTGKPSFWLGEDEIELGLGIHGEAGVKKSTLLRNDDIVDTILDCVTADLARRFPQDGDNKNGVPVALLVNNLGGTTVMELSIVGRRAVQYLKTNHRNGRFNVKRVYAGSFMTSLEMPGISLSLIRLVSTDGDSNNNNNNEGNSSRMLARLDAATHAPAWNSVCGDLTVQEQQPIAQAPTKSTDSLGDVGTVGSASAASATAAAAVKRAILAVADMVIDNEQYFSQLDQAVGDGDMGYSLARGAKLVKAKFESADASAFTNLSRVMLGIADCVKQMGGSSGPIYAIFFIRMAQTFAAAAAASEDQMQLWCRAIKSGADGISERGGARRNDRTLLDAILPAVDRFEELLNATSPKHEAHVIAEQLAEASRTGAEHTKNLFPRKGRSQYMKLRCKGKADPGAVAVSMMFTKIAEALKQKH